jgi:hypothetical protein
VASVHSEDQFGEDLTSSAGGRGINKLGEERLAV